MRLELKLRSVLRLGLQLEVRRALRLRVKAGGRLCYGKKSVFSAILRSACAYRLR